SASTTYAFESGTVTKTDAWNDGEDSGNSETTYKYTYDTEKSLVYLVPSKFSGTAQNGKEYSYSSVSEAEALLKEYGYTGDNFAAEKAGFAADFATKTVYKYEIADKALKLTEYFDGTFPISVEFGRYDSESGLAIWLLGGKISVSKNSEEGGEEKYSVYPTFEGETFSGTVYSVGEDEETDSRTFTSVGTVSGTYASSGTGTEGCTVKITFTAIPDSISIVAKNTEYTLTQETGEDTYTLVE
ncbi:hypothetical protein, partial [Treponema saccharophilum]|uniref:hypothetical protein n=1 Tax=Treponema saccharophilum TaxID=165 RepID=UPI00386C5E64